MAPAEPFGNPVSPPNRPQPGAAAGDAASAPRRGPSAEVETFRIVRWISGPTSSRLQGPEATTAEAPFRPTLRPPVPILTVLDDGALDEGEEIRIRKESFVIGRSSGDLVIPLDATLSGRHAEIRLTGDHGRRQWTLHNLESVNGTFVRVSIATLGDDSIVILGTRRFRFERPQPAAPREANRDATLKLDEHVAAAARWPRLVDASIRPNAPRFQLESDHVTIGRKGTPCGIQLDDPQIAPVHAEIFLDTGGVWKISSRKTRNGVWVNTAATLLQSCCFFQCGEQRFKFVVPDPADGATGRPPPGA